MMGKVKGKKINVVTLGCSKNVVDSEHVMAQLAAAGYDVVFDSNGTEARTVVVNTCGFIGDAKEESINTILGFVRAKEEGAIDRLFVIGCLSERYAEELRREIPEVDAYVYGVMTEGAGSKPDALELTKANVYEEILKGSEVLDNAMVSETGRVLVVTPATYTLMKQCTDITMETDIGNDLRLKGVISMLDGMDVVRVPASRLPADFGFMIAHPCATVAPTKLESYKAHEDPPGISGSLVEGRITYDAFVLDNKTKAIYYQRGGLVLTSAAGTATGATKVTVSTTKGKGNSYKYKVDAAVPVAGADCSAWTDWNGTADITAATGKTLVIVEVDGNGLAVKAGSVTVTAKA